MAQASDIVSWFQELALLHNGMLHISNLTEQGRKAFSKQKPSDLLPDQVNKDRLTAYCESYIGEVVDSYYPGKQDGATALNNVMNIVRERRTK